MCLIQGTIRIKLHSRSTHFACLSIQNIFNSVCNSEFSTESPIDVRSRSELCHPLKPWWACDLTWDLFIVPDVTWIKWFIPWKQGEQVEKMMWGPFDLFKCFQGGHKIHLTFQVATASRDGWDLSRLERVRSKWKLCPFPRARSPCSPVCRGLCRAPCLWAILVWAWRPCNRCSLECRCSPECPCPMRCQCRLQVERWYF